MTHQEAVESLATERYLLDDMPNSDRQAFEDHFFSCDLCADDMRVAAAMFKGAKAGFAGGAATAQVVPMVRQARGEAAGLVSIRRAALGRGRRARVRHHLSVVLGGSVAPP